MDEQTKMCRYYPTSEEDCPVCGAGSDVSGSRRILGDYCSEARSRFCIYRWEQQAKDLRAEIEELKRNAGTHYQRRVIAVQQEEMAKLEQQFVDLRAKLSQAEAERDEARNLLTQDQWLLQKDFERVKSERDEATTRFGEMASRYNQADAARKKAQAALTRCRAMSEKRRKAVKQQTLLFRTCVGVRNRLFNEQERLEAALKRLREGVRRCPSCGHKAHAEKFL